MEVKEAFIDMFMGKIDLDAVFSADETDKDGYPDEVYLVRISKSSDKTAAVNSENGFVLSV